MAQQENLFGEIDRLWDIYEKCMPDVARAYNELPMEVYKDGVLISVNAGNSLDDPISFVTGLLNIGARGDGIEGR